MHTIRDITAGAEPVIKIGSAPNNSFCCPLFNGRMQQNSKNKVQIFIKLVPALNICSKMKSAQSLHREFMKNAVYHHSDKFF
ncbi:hypothetical protein MMINT_12280 [Candidatus Methanomassiliicoccus intestinalis Issoire-Mx1]|uniref:Uncharacterized protein n=1 Tax=Methanomassiliicoccus intestinalis (strain Issoire-Mx1) TaxID=1295009 RepID=R9TAX0_METII|nr:hypothetical protein MMINT_12280 [Candidatus Methanomassiliicoccus intestinalis Issoire-Mx1]